ncbi:MAG TPA: hypothetical protein VFB16_10890 [Bauldia sp.]|nr:hypothetical protein [Bauldia sp.]
MRREAWPAIAGVVLLVLGSPPAHAETREKVRLILLDKCVADEWARRTIRAKVVDECKCAAARVARDLTDGQVAAFVDVAPTTPRDYWADASRACFTSPIK